MDQPMSMTLLYYEEPSPTARKAAGPPVGLGAPPGGRLRGPCPLLNLLAAIQHLKAAPARTPSSWCAGRGRPVLVSGVRWLR